MKIKHLIASGLMLGAITTTVFADMTLNSKAEVEGTWKLQYSKNSLEGKEQIPREDTWAFQGGKLTILHIPREGKYYDQPPVIYEIEDGKLKVPLIGNSRFDTFSLVELSDKTMTLKGKFGNYYFFTKK